MHAAVGEGVFVNESLQRADGDGLRFAIKDAGAFAEAFLGANARADLGHVAGQVGDLGRFEEMAFGGERHPFGNAIGERTAAAAAGFRTLDTAAGLFAGAGFVEAGGDFEEIGDALGGGAFGRVLAVEQEPGEFAAGFGPGLAL